MQVFRWLNPGLRVKRWIVTAFVGLCLVLIGVLLLLGPGTVSMLGKQTFVLIGDMLGAYSRWNGIVFLFAGGFLLWFAVDKAINSIVQTLLPYEEEKLVAVLNRHRQQKKGPEIVAMGGGTGLPNLLRGLKPYTQNITAVVTVADDGGSSGKLRGEMGMIPPGDVRNCLLALADTEPLMEEIFSYRFKTHGDLSGHNVGNLIIAALNDKRGFKGALSSLSHVLAVKGQVLPVSDTSLTLMAQCRNGEKIIGESNITHEDTVIDRVELAETGVSALPEVVEAIKSADAVILGPGSLYTSIVPNIIVPGVVEAIKASSTRVIYVSNIMTQKGETEDYSASDHVEALEKHAGSQLVDTVLVNNEMSISPEILEKYLKEGQKPVRPDLERLNAMVERVVMDDFSSQDLVIRHNPRKLGRVIIREIIRDNMVKNKLSLPNFLQGLFKKPENQ